MFHLKRLLGMKKKKSYSKVNRDKLRAYIQLHPKATQAEIAKHFGCNQSAVCYAIKAAGLNYRSKVPRKLNAVELKKYVKQHPKTTQADITKAFNCTQGGSSHALRVNRIKYRKMRVSPLFMSYPGHLRDYVSKHPDMTQREIAEFFKCDPSSVSRALRTFGISYSNKIDGRPPKQRDSHLEMTQRKPCKKVNREELRSYIQLHPEATQAEIAKHLGCVEASVGYAIRTAGINYRYKNTKKLNIAELKKYIEQYPNMLQKDIAKHFQCAESTVYRAVKTTNIGYRLKRVYKLPPEKLKKFIEDHPEATQADIAKAFNCTRNGISNTLKVNGINYKTKCGKRPRIFTDPDILRAYVLDHPTATQQEIAKHFKCSKGLVTMAIKNFGIIYRDKRANNKSASTPELLRDYALNHQDEFQNRNKPRSCEFVPRY